MARRKKDDQSAGAAILFFGFIIILVLVSISPIFILLYGLFYTIKFCIRYQKVNKTYSDFWLNETEKNEFTRSYDTWLEYDNEIDELHNLASKHSVSINVNGNYSRKGKIGKQVQDRLDDITNSWQEAKEQKEYFEYLPYNRWKKFHIAAANGLAGILGFVVWLLMFEFLCADYKVDATQLFKDYSNFIFSEAGNYLFGLSGLATIVAFLISKWILGLIVKGMYSPEPPRVDPSNFNLY